MLRPGRFGARRLWLVVFDAVVVAFTLGRELRLESGEQWLVRVACVAALVCLAVAMSGGYTRVLGKSWGAHGYPALIGATVGGGTGWWLARWQHRFWDGGPDLENVLLLAVSLLLGRWVLVQIHRTLLKPRRVWIVEDNVAVAREIARKVQQERWRYRLVFWSPVPEPERMVEWLEGCDAVLCTATSRETMEPYCKRAGKELLLVPASADVLLMASTLQKVDDLLVLALPTMQLTAAQRLCKRAFDVATACGLLLLSCPVMAAVAALVAWESAGGILFRQERRGELGRSFEVLKFRTMCANAEAQTGPTLAQRDDPRITRLGKWLRATRLDELPQLWNVLRGDMSLVGPRPEREFFAKQFEQELPEYALRTRVKPGLTGLAQVWGRYTTSAEAKLRLDLHYIANYSFLLDLQLVLQTVWVMLRREQAAGAEAPVRETGSAGIAPRMAAASAGSGETASLRGRQLSI